MEQLYARYKESAAFFVVYIKEAHPSDGWQVQQNERQGITIKDPATYHERVSIAENACHLLKINMPCLVDGIDNAVNRAYAAWPDRIYCIDTTGRIAVMGDHGPFGFAPSIQKAAQWLQSVTRI